MDMVFITHSHGRHMFFCFFLLMAQICAFEDDEERYGLHKGLFNKGCGGSAPMQGINSINHEKYVVDYNIVA